MDLKDMILSIVYQSSNGLVPIQIVGELASQYRLQTTTKQVLQIVDKNPQLFLEENGRIKGQTRYSLK